MAEVMIRVLVVSDSHGINDNVRAAIEKTRQKYGKIDKMFHLGDVGANWIEVEHMLGRPTYIVRGNTDYDVNLKQKMILTVGTHNVYLAHGHNEGVHFGLDSLRYNALENGCDIALFGHLHVPILDEGDVIIVNPGSVTSPRQAGRQKTFAVMEIMDDESVRFTFDEI